MPQASIRAHCLGTDKATDCGPHPSSPDGCGQVQACPLGHCQEMAELTPVAPCQGPGGQPRGDVAWASVGAVGRVGSGFPAPPSLKNRDPRCAWRGHCRGDRAALGVTGAWGLRRGGGGDKGQQTGGWGPEPLASPVKGGHSCRDPPPVTEQILHLGLGGCLTGLALLLRPGCQQGSHRRGERLPSPAAVGHSQAPTRASAPASGGPCTYPFLRGTQDLSRHWLLGHQEP